MGISLPFHRMTEKKDRVEEPPKSMHPVTNQYNEQRMFGLMIF